MEIGHLYFLENKYFADFNDNKLMSNHEFFKGSDHDRPCYCCVKMPNDDIYWGIPISSQVEKCRKIYDKKVSRYGVCDTIEFGNVLGIERAFLIQNMCPISEEYIRNEYIHCGEPVVIDHDTHNRIKRKATKVLALLHNNNGNLIFPDVLKIEEILKQRNKLI